MIAERCETPFETHIVLLHIFILNKLVVFLVDRVVRQVHVPIVLVELGGVTLRGEPRQAFLIDIDSERLVAGYDYIDAQVKFMAVDQEGIRDIAANDGGFIDVELVKRLNDVNAAALRGVRWLDDPDVALRFGLSQFLIVGVEVMKLLREDVGIGDEIKLGTPETLLHLHIVVAETVLPRDLVALREVIDTLELIEALVQVALARTRRPQDIPFMRVSIIKAVGLQNAPNQLRVALQKLVEHFLVFNVIATARALRGHRCLQELLLCNGLNVLNLIQSLHRRRIPVLVKVHDGLLQILIRLVEKVLLRARLSIIARGDEKRVVVLQVTQSVEDLKEFESTYFVF